MKKPLNPFVTNRYITKEYFCDRERETAFVKKQIDNGRNLAIISERRLGKTGLIHHYFSTEAERGEAYFFFIDLYATGSLQEMVSLLSQSIYDRPVCIGEVTSPSLSLDEIFTYLGEADKPCIVAIDEFQQIATYKEKNVEALLRTKMQYGKNVSFIFSGSKRHTMMQMFQSAAKPFYQSAVVMNLEPIPLQTYTDFAKNMFAMYDKQIDSEAVALVYEIYDGVTWYLQMLMNELFAMTPAGCTAYKESIPDAIYNILCMQEASYQELLSNLSVKQRELLYAIGKEGGAKGVTSGAFIKKYSLGTSSSVQAALNGLLDKDILTKSSEGYRIYDFFLSKYLSK